MRRVYAEESDITPQPNRRKEAGSKLPASQTVPGSDSWLIDKPTAMGHLGKDDKEPSRIVARLPSAA